MACVVTKMMISEKNPQSCLASTKTIEEPKILNSTKNISSCKFFRDRIQEPVNAPFQRLNHG